MCQPGSLFFPSPMTWVFSSKTRYFLRNKHVLFVLYQLVPEVSVVISQATFSSDGKNVCATLADGTVAIFNALNLQMHCRINPSAYLFPTPRYDFLLKGCNIKASRK